MTIKLVTRYLYLVEVWTLNYNSTKDHILYSRSTRRMALFHIKRRNYAKPINIRLVRPYFGANRRSNGTS